MDALLKDTTDEKLLNLLGRNRGLLRFAEKQYTKAFNEFTAVLSRSPHDMVSANNKVRCFDIVLPFIKKLYLFTVLRHKDIELSYNYTLVSFIYEFNHCW